MLLSPYGDLEGLWTVMNDGPTSVTEVINSQQTCHNYWHVQQLLLISVIVQSVNWAQQQSIWHWQILLVYPKARLAISITEHSIHAEVAQLPFMQTQMFITKHTRTRHWTISEGKYFSPRLPPYLFQISFNILPFMSRSSSSFFPFGFPPKPVCISHFFYVRYIHTPLIVSFSIWSLKLQAIWRKVQIMKVLIT
jgi:hypothetical protein